MKNKNIVKIIKIIITVVVLIIGIFIVVKNINNNTEVVKQGQDINKDKTIINGVDMSDWKTYRNEEYGYLIKYPEDWGLSSNTKTHPSTSNEHVFIFSDNIKSVTESTDMYTVKIYINDNIDNETLESLGGCIKEYDDDKVISDYNIITKYGFLKKCIRFSLVGGPHKNIALKSIKNSKIFTLTSFVSVVNIDSKKGVDLINKIISSFEFTE